MLLLMGGLALQQNILRIISEDQEYDKVGLIEIVHPKDLIKHQVGLISKISNALIIK